MTLNYVKHDEEFHCTIKLVNGEELIGKVIVSRDKSTFPATDLLYVQDPLVVQSFTKEMDETRAVKGIGFTQWQNFSDEDFYIIREKDILTVSSMTKECMFMYETYINGDDGTVQKKSSLEMNVDEHKSLGHRGKIDDARQKFEDIFKTS